MKKIFLTGIIIILVLLFAVTCDLRQPEEEIEYTDVEYSKDGSQITLYIDGSKPVPVTEADRAINKELATMAYDFFEVIFVGATTANQSRTQWELGQPAGIADVPRNIDYVYGAAKTVNIAVMFVGKKDGRTLLGIGTLLDANGAAINTTIDGTTDRVTFEIGAITTGLLIAGEKIQGATGAGTEVSGVMANSFAYATTGNPTGYQGITTTNSRRDDLGGLSYPRYALPENNTTTPVNVDATYTFSYYTGTKTFVYDEFIRVSNPTTGIKPLIQKRVPRFRQTGRYREPKDNWTTTTAVAFNGAYATITDGAAFNRVVGLRFNPKGSGVFSFYIQIPVYMVNKLASQFGGSAAETWYIRTGAGSELYSLDDGIANGGCVFMSIGASSSNWIDIEWVWL